MILEPTYIKLIQAIQSYISNKKQLAVAGMHDSGKTFLFYHLKKLLEESNLLFIDVADQENPNLKDILSPDNYKELTTNGGTVVINYGYKIIPTTDSIKYLFHIKQILQEKFSWVIFINYYSYKQNANIIYHKAFRLNFLPISLLKNTDFPILESRYAKEIGNINKNLIPEVQDLSGGNPGLYKSLWGLALSKSEVTIELALKEPSIIARLEKITEELDKVEIETLLGKVINDKIRSRLKLFGYINQKGEVFTPIFFDYLTKLETESDLTFNLTPHEKDLFNFIISKKGEICSRDELAQALWKNLWSEKYSDWAIDKFVSDLRNKLKGTKYENKLIAKRGEGYYMNDL